MFFDSAGERGPGHEIQVAAATPGHDHHDHDHSDHASGAVDSSLAKAAFSLKTRGDISKPIQLGEAFSVMMLTGVTPATDVELADARDAITRKIRTERSNTARATMLSESRKRYGAETNYDLVKAIVIPSPDEAAPNAVAR